MKLSCPISGIIYPVPEFQWIGGISNPHPIFSLNTKQLLSQAAKWSSGQMTEDETKLLFLALLKSTGETLTDDGSYKSLVEFNHIASPSPELIAKNMELLMTVSQWRANSILSHKLKLPRYIISYPQNHTLDNIRVYLDTWLNRKAASEQAYNSAYANRMTADMRREEEKLVRLIKGGLKRGQVYELGLAKWALTACGYDQQSDEYLWNYWTKLFCLKEPEIYSTRLRKEKLLVEDLTELVDTMGEKLEVYSREANSISKAVLIHVRNLLKINKDGPMAFYGLEDIDFTHAPAYITKLKEAVELAPKDAPIAKDYPNTLAWLRARALYGQAQEYKKLEMEHANKMKEQFQARLLDEIIANEEVELGLDEMEQVQFADAVIAKAGLGNDDEDNGL